MNIIFCVSFYRGQHSTTTVTSAEIISIEKLNKKNDWILLGSGEFGEVYKAIYNQCTKVAIKVKFKFSFRAPSTINQIQQLFQSFSIFQQFNELKTHLNRTEFEL